MLLQQPQFGQGKQENQGRFGPLIRLTASVDSPSQQPPVSRIVHGRAHVVAAQEPFEGPKRLMFPPAPAR